MEFDQSASQHIRCNTRRFHYKFFLYQLKIECAILKTSEILK